MCFSGKTARNGAKRQTMTALPFVNRRKLIASNPAEYFSGYQSQLPFCRKHTLQQ
jgi:hypothetical protein